MDISQATTEEVEEEDMTREERKILDDMAVIVSELGAVIARNMDGKSGRSVVGALGILVGSVARASKTPKIVIDTVHEIAIGELSRD